MPTPPKRILFLHPDTYGDLFLFEPVLRLVRQAWPHAEMAVLIRHTYADIAPLLAADGVRWLTTECDPYRDGPDANPTALTALRETVQGFAPDCVVAACSEQTWFEPAVASFLPHARQISLGAGMTDPVRRAALDAVLPVDWAKIYPEKVIARTELSEWEKNLQLASDLLENEVARWWPVAQVPDDFRARAARVLAELDLTAGDFAVCAAAGIANVKIKSWPAGRYGETVAWLERERGIRVLLLGHESERERLEAVREAARAHGAAQTALWLGQNGEMLMVAALLDSARFYFGNDTGALHLAAALGKPVCSIFGGGHWPRFAPVAHRSLTVVQPLPCIGCAWDCYFADAPCVQTISTGSVRRALEQFLLETEGSSIFEAEGLEPAARAVIDAATPRLRFMRADSADRLRQIQELTIQASSLSGQLQANDAEHQRQIGELTAQFKNSETDRDARLYQVEELGALLQMSETDRDIRLRQAEELTAMVKECESDRAARLEQIEELTTLFRASETDRAARLRQVEELTALLRESEADRAIRWEQIEELTALLRESEADRAARLRQIEELTALLHENESATSAHADLLAETARQS